MRMKLYRIAPIPRSQLMIVAENTSQAVEIAMTQSVAISRRTRRQLVIEQEDCRLVARNQTTGKSCRRLVPLPDTPWSRCRRELQLPLDDRVDRGSLAVRYRFGDHRRLGAYLPLDDHRFNAAIDQDDITASRRIFGCSCQQRDRSRGALTAELLIAMRIDKHCAPGVGDRRQATTVGSLQPAEIGHRLPRAKRDVRCLARGRIQDAQFRSRRAMQGYKFRFGVDRQS